MPYEFARLERHPTRAAVLLSSFGAPLVARVLFPLFNAGKGIVSYKVEHNLQLECIQLPLVLHQSFPVAFDSNHARAELQVRLPGLHI